MAWGESLRSLKAAEMAMNFFFFIGSLFSCLSPAVASAQYQ
jgi:hypothetical protein